MSRQARQNLPVAEWQRLHSVLPMHSSDVDRFSQRGQLGSPQSFFWRQKWQQMPTWESYTLPRPWLVHRRPISFWNSCLSFSSGVTSGFRDTSMRFPFLLYSCSSCTYPSGLSESGLSTGAYCGLCPWIRLEERVLSNDFDDFTCRTLSLLLKFDVGLRAWNIMSRMDVCFVNPNAFIRAWFSLMRCKRSCSYRLNVVAMAVVGV
mmetsp:Transcript_20884/g.34962  ORF Transcript_20884/g.34962 Transcript_20884/m.34962 type:complete len:205 (+) Transcript_20884:348-962(+)